MEDEKKDDPVMSQAFRASRQTYQEADPRRDAFVLGWLTCFEQMSPGVTFTIPAKVTRG